MVAMHHTPMSFDMFHSGSGYMAQMLEEAVNEARRVPNAVLSAGANNYQRIEMAIPGGKIPSLSDLAAIPI